MNYKDWDNYDLIIEYRRLDDKIHKNIISMIVLMVLAFSESLLSFFIPVPFWVFLITMVFCYGGYLVHYFIYKKNRKKFYMVIDEINERKLD